MTRRLRVHNGVEADLFEAFSYHEDEAPNQVDRLYELFLYATTRLISQMPNAFAPLFNCYRHIYLRPFKYYVAYRVTSETIDILALRHGRENPEKVEAQLDGRTFDGTL